MTTNAQRVHREFGQSLRYDNLDSVGISVPDECVRQLAAGVASFAGSLDSLFQLLAERRTALLQK